MSRWKRIEAKALERAKGYGVSRRYDKSKSSYGSLSSAAAKPQVSCQIIHSQKTKYYGKEELAVSTFTHKSGSFVMDGKWHDDGKYRYHKGSVSVEPSHVTRVNRK